MVLESEDLAVLVERMLRASGRHLDLSSLFVDAQLVEGQRPHIVIPPITSQHWALNIRKHISRASRTANLVRMGSLTNQVAVFLDALVQTGLNILVSGATQAGKTTTVRALAGAILGVQRVVSCEEAFRLALRSRDCATIQTQPPNFEGVGEISPWRLVKEVLCMCPDRLFIGKVREAEAPDLLIAMNLGLLPMCTIYADFVREAVIKICMPPLLAGGNISSDLVIPTVASVIDLVVHLDPDRSGRRTVREVAILSGRVENGTTEFSDAFHRDSTGNLVRDTGAPDVAERFNRAGHDLTVLPSSRPADPQEVY